MDAPRTYRRRQHSRTNPRVLTPQHVEAPKHVPLDYKMQLKTQHFSSSITQTTNQSKHQIEFKQKPEKENGRQQAKHELPSRSSHWPD